MIPLWFVIPTRLPVRDLPFIYVIPKSFRLGIFPVHLVRASIVHASGLAQDDEDNNWCYKLRNWHICMKAVAKDPSGKYKVFYFNLIVGSSTSSSSLPFYANGASDPIGDFQLQDQLSFLNDDSPTLGHNKNLDLFYPPPHSDLSSSLTATADPSLFPSFGWGGSLHRRSCSVNDACLGSEDPNSGLGWKPCLYFARGYCKNGTSCRFLQVGLGDGDGTTIVGSPYKIEMMDQCHEVFRSKSAQQQQQRLAAASQLMASSSFILTKVHEFPLTAATK
ncbi:Zinc finger, CCCH-type [Sesbania bispinosa]|nr:Zinc finger, CCCH-type [Sesbania bispinosa]